ncbi:MAG: argininosuccinate lyase, partial [Anaerolineales bacterium]|nr:argininosuccinate lyase [Anaerolineales bacterium]
LFFLPLMDIHFAHLIMLERTGILNTADAREIASGLLKITEDSVASVEFDGTYEDLFFYVEYLLDNGCDKNTAGKLHTARSRNDIDVTMYRIKWREELLETIEAFSSLRSVLIDVSDREKTTILPLHTHTQPAQPSTVAHYLLGVVEHLERDHGRLVNAWDTMNFCPMGACAITGTGFQIDRELTSALLGFDQATGNTYASIGSQDYLLEALGSLLIAQTNLSKVIQDLLLWSMKEFDYFRLQDGFVQPSSIMPQKRNPVSLEHSRAINSRALGNTLAVFQMLHNTPFGDIVDMEDDMQPVVARVFDDTRRPVRMIAGALETAEFNRVKLMEKAGENWITVTEMADTLVRDEDISFRQAHTIVRMVVQSQMADSGTDLLSSLQAASRKTLGKAVSWDKRYLDKVLSPQNFIDVRQTQGGPGEKISEAAVKAARETLAADQAWTQKRKKGLDTYRPRLREIAGKL